MSIKEFREKYKGSGKERYNKCIRAELDGGHELLELRRYVSYLRNVKPMWETEIEETRKILDSIINQTPKKDRFKPLLDYIDHCLDSKPMAGGTGEARSILARIETILTRIRDEMVAEIQAKYGINKG
jgi:hypothetical protein